MKKKLIKPGETHGYIGENTSIKKKVKPYVYPKWMLDYWYERDMSLLYSIFVCQETKDAIQERLNNNLYERN